MAASLGLNPEAFFSCYPYSSPFLAGYAPNSPATGAAAAADLSAELDDHHPFEYSPAPIFAGAGDDHDEKAMHACIHASTSCESEEKRMRVNGRIGFRTRSEVEILDDGFKWRKYGKKAVKNSPNPRNYYRCSTEGCGVKKRVERDRDDPRYVITTYDGAHNHATPCSGAAAAVLQYAGNYYSPPRSAGNYYSPPGSAGSPPAAYSAGSLLF